MCRSIRVLHAFEPPTTASEIQAAATQYVRKVSGYRQPPQLATEAFDRTVQEIAASTARLLGALPSRASTRTREGEREKARARGAARESKR